MRIESPDPAFNGPNAAPRAAANPGQPSRQGGNGRAMPQATARPVGPRDDTVARADLPTVVVPGRLIDAHPPSVALVPKSATVAVPVSVHVPKSAAAPASAQALKSAAVPVHAGKAAALPVPLPMPGGPEAPLPAWLSKPLPVPAPAPAPAPRAYTPPVAAKRRPGPGLPDQLRTAWFELQRLFGLSGAIGIGLLLLGAALLTGLAPALQHNARQLTTAAATSRDERAQQRVEQLSAPSGAEVVQRFVEGFPPATQQVDDLAFVVQQAKAAGVQLARADYQMRSEATLGLVRYQINLPVQARYATLRRFVAAVLNARPNAALDELTLERKEGDDIEARVRFTFVYRSGDGQ